MLLQQQRWHRVSVFKKRAISFKSALFFTMLYALFYLSSSSTALCQSMTGSKSNSAQAISTVSLNESPQLDISVPPLTGEGIENRKISLDKVLQMAETANPTLVAAKSGLKVSAAGIGIAKQRPNPILSGLYGFGTTTSVQGQDQQVYATLTIEAPGKRRSRILLARDNLFQDEAEYLAQRLDILGQIRQAYAEVAIAEANLNVINEQARLLDQLVEIANKRFKAGAAAEAEVYQAKLSRQQLETKRIDINSDIVLARHKMSLLMGNQLPFDFVISEDLFQIPKTDQLLQSSTGNSLLPDQQLVQIALKERPDLKAAQLQCKVAKSQIRLAKRNRIPDLTVSGGTQFLPLPAAYSPNFRKTFFIGGFFIFNVEVPVLNRKKAPVILAQEQLKQNELQVKDLEMKVKDSVQDAYITLVYGLQKLQKYQVDLIPASEEVLKLSKISYTYGKTGLANVILAQQADAQIRQGYLDSVADYQKAWVALEQALGKAVEN